MLWVGSKPPIHYYEIRCQSTLLTQWWLFVRMNLCSRPLLSPSTRTWWTICRDSGFGINLKVGAICILCIMKVCSLCCKNTAHCKTTDVDLSLDFCHQLGYQRPPVWRMVLAPVHPWCCFLAFYAIRCNRTTMYQFVLADKNQTLGPHLYQILQWTMLSHSNRFARSVAKMGRMTRSNKNCGWFLRLILHRLERALLDCVRQ